MTITLTYEQGFGTGTEIKVDKMVGVKAPAILAQFGVLQVADLHGRILTMMPLARIVRMDFSDNSLELPN